MATLFLTPETQPSKSAFLLFYSCIPFSSCESGGCVIDFLFALIFTSLHTRVCDSNIDLFRDAVLPGFNAIGCNSGYSCASLRVCPGWQAANASLASDVIPFASKEFAIALLRAPCSLERLLTPKKFPLQSLNPKGAAEETYKQNVNDRDQHLQLRSTQASHSTLIQRTSIRCFFRALARAPTSFIGFAAAHLLHLRKSKNLLESTLM